MATLRPKGSPTLSVAFPGRRPFRADVIHLGAEIRLGPIETLPIAVALGTDAFSVALAVGHRIAGLRPTFRLTFHFGLFQFLMPMAAWAVTRQVAQPIRVYDHWVAAILLGVIAVKMLWEAANRREPGEAAGDVSRGLSLVALSLATSLDAFAVGMGMAFLSGRMIYPSLIIGVVAATMTFVGLRLGNHAPRLLGKRAELLGAAVLFLLAVKIALTQP